MGGGVEVRHLPAFPTEASAVTLRWSQRLHANRQFAFSVFVQPSKHQSPSLKAFIPTSITHVSSLSWRPTNTSDPASAVAWERNAGRRS